MIETTGVNKSGRGGVFCSDRTFTAMVNVRSETKTQGDTSISILSIYLPACRQAGSATAFLRGPFVNDLTISFYIIARYDWIGILRRM
jgi:hypothetical protein